MKSFGGLFVVFAMLVSACSSTDGADDLNQDEIAYVEASSTTSPSTTQATTTSESDETADASPTTAEGYSAPESTEAPTTSSTVSSGATTTKVPAAEGGGGTPKVDPFKQYGGILGFFGPNDLITPAVAANPVAAAGTLPLTGQAGPSPNRPAVVVKIDNSSKAWPHEGLNSADIVIEEEVEWGITRLAAIFHSNQAQVGPVRSGRSTDISFLVSLGNPALVYSGANDVMDALLLNQKNVQNFSAARTSGYWRKSGRRAPSNLWANTSSFSDLATGGAPPAQFHYRGAGQAAPTGKPTSSISVTYPNNKVNWSWTGSEWARSQAGKAHMTDGSQVTAANVVVIEARIVPTGLVDSAGGPVPEVVWLGNGLATVFTDGKRIDAVWTRSTLASASVLTDSAGNVIKLTPGRTWVQLTGTGATNSS